MRLFQQTIHLCCTITLDNDVDDPVDAAGRSSVTANPNTTHQSIHQREISKFQNLDSEEKFLRTSGLLGPVKLEYSAMP